MTKRLENTIRSGAYVAAEPGLTETESRAMLRRQFIGSVAAAVAVMAVAGLMAMRPAHGVATETERHVSVVQQPTFVEPASRVIAFRQH
jgi:hypothetical protein